MLSTVVLAILAQAASSIDGGTVLFPAPPSVFDQPFNVTDVSYATADRRFCTAEMKAAHAAATSQLGIAPLDILGHHVGRTVHRWHPSSSEKEAICGAFRELKYHVEKDRDWYINVEPLAGTRSATLLDRCLSDDRNCSPQCDQTSWAKGGVCVHGEIKPHSDFPMQQVFVADSQPIVRGENSRFYSSRFLAHNAAEMSTHQICVYGPWVRDFHTHKPDRSPSHVPEIHPAELIWWNEPLRIDRNGIGIITHRHVVAIQDGSGRFASGAVAPGDLAWAYAPHYAEIAVAMDVDPAGRYLRAIALREEHAKNVQVDAILADPGIAGRDLETVQVNGTPVVRILNYVPQGHVTVSFRSFCHDLKSKRLLGFVVVRSKFGSAYSKESAGYHVLRIADAEIDLTGVQPSDRDTFLGKAFGELK